MTDMNVDPAKAQREKPRKSKSSSTNRKINLKDYHPKIQKLFQGKEHKLRMIGNWVVGETLGMGGYSKVKLGLHKETGQKAALKIMFADQSGRISDSKKRQLFRELNVMKKVEHPNVVHLYEYDAEAEYPEANGSSTACIMSALEFAAGGELFDYLMYTGHFDSRATRTYFGQLISGLKAMHEAGIAHRDLKPENLLMDSSFTLKIADFGFATQFRDEKGRQHLMKTPCGTKNYLAPEFWKGQQYSYKCDIFACGIILFTIYAGFPPFMEAQPKDWWWDKYMWAVKYRAKADSMSADEAVQANKFRAEADRRMKLFWKAHTKKRQFDDDDFKELALNLIHPSARQRYDLKQIQDHVWMTKGPTYSKNELKHYLGKRVRLVLRQRAKKIRNMMMTKNVQPVRQEHVVRSFNDLTPMQKRALELDPKGEFLKNVLSVSDGLSVQSAFQFMTFVAPAEMAARLERAITGMGGLCNVTPEENEILIKLKLKFSQPNADKTFVQTTDECVISVRLYLLGDRKDVESKDQAETKEQDETSDATVDAAQTAQTVTETEKTETNTNTNSNNDDDSKDEEYDEAAVAHDRNWLITFKRLRGQHSTYCSLVEKLLFHEDVSPALGWKEMEEIQDNEPENYELHDSIEECENVKTTVLENEDNINAEIVTDKNI